MDTNSVAAPLQWKGRIATYIDNHGPALFGAILILVVGFFVSRWIGRLATHSLARKELGLEPPTQMLLVRLIRLAVILLALVVAAGTAGVDVTAMVAGVGVAGLGVGLAMQGVLSNIVAGLTIIFTKPFRVGEYIEIMHEEGQVTTIELFSTTLLHADRSKVVIPNRKIVGEILHNYGTIRQLSLSVGVAYGTDLSQALTVIADVLTANPRVLKDPAPGVGIAALADSSINIAIRPWASVADFGPAAPEIYQAIIHEFRAKKIDIPFPQRDVRLLGESSPK